MAKILPIANNLPTQVRAAGTVTAGTFVTLGSGGVSAQTADTQQCFGVVAQDGVVGDQVTVWTGGDFEADGVAVTAVGVRLEWATSTGVQAHATATSRSLGFSIGFTPTSGGRVRMRLVTTYNGTEILL